MRYRLGVCAILLEALSCDPVGGPAAALIVGDALDEFGTRVDATVSQAVANGGYLVEKSGRQLDMLLANAAIALREERQLAISKLSDENQRLMSVLRQAIEQLESLEATALKLEDFAALDIQDLVNQVPLLPDKHFIRRIDGYSQTFREDGVYTLRVTGNAFGPGYTAKIKVGSHDVSLHAMRSPPPHMLEADVPASALNGLFGDHSLERVPLAITAYAAGNPTPMIDYNDAIVLLPRSPAEYSFVEHAEERALVGEPFDSKEGHGTLGKTGKEFHPVSGSVSASCPADAVIAGQPRLRASPGTHMEWQGCTNSDENRTVTCNAKHIIHDQDTQIYVIVPCLRYRPVLRDAKKTCTDPISGEVRERLQYRQPCVFPLAETSTFDLAVKFFNGERVSITASDLKKPGLEGRIEGQGAGRRVLVELQQPKH